MAEKGTFSKSSFRTSNQGERGEVLRTSCFLVTRRWKMCVSGIGMLGKASGQKIGQWRSYCTTYLVPFHHLPPMAREPVEVPSYGWGP